MWAGVHFWMKIYDVILLGATSFYIAKNHRCSQHTLKTPHTQDYFCKI